MPPLPVYVVLGVDPRALHCTRPALLTELLPHPTDNPEGRGVGSLRPPDGAVFRHIIGVRKTEPFSILDEDRPFKKLMDRFSSVSSSYLRSQSPLKKKNHFRPCSCFFRKSLKFTSCEVTVPDRAALKA